MLNFGFQRELPGNFLLEANYVDGWGAGCLLWVTLQPSPISRIRPRGNSCGMLSASLKSKYKTANRLPHSLGSKTSWVGTPFCHVHCWNLTARRFDHLLTQLVAKGDLSDTVAGLALFGSLTRILGCPPRPAANGYIGNYASSNYNALLLTLRKRISNGLQFDFNYTYSHSIDNVSEMANNYINYTFNGAGLVCDLNDLRTCRASSDFDARHVISANYIYDLPFGRGRHLSNAPKALDYIVGGWSWSGIVSWRTGYPFNVNTVSFPTAFTLDSPALVVHHQWVARGHPYGHWWRPPIL